MELSQFNGSLLPKGVMSPPGRQSLPIPVLALAFTLRYWSAFKMSQLGGTKLAETIHFFLVVLGFGWFRAPSWLPERSRGQYRKKSAPVCSQGKEEGADCRIIKPHHQSGLGDGFTLVLLM